MATRIEVLLSDTSGNKEGVGEPRKGNAWFGALNPLHTIQISLSKYIGTITIEASLAKEPTEEDWFPIWLNLDKPYLQFDAPLGEGITDTLIFNVEGNFMWLRAKYDRSNVTIQIPDEEPNLLGNISKILLVR